MSDSAEKSKIIVDEDWKAKVQAEKELANASPREAGQSAVPADKSPEKSSPTQPPPELGDLPLPPTSLSFLATTLATQAMLALGQIPHPITGKTEQRLNQAKHHIDTLSMLEEKTAGNRTADETELFSALLHQLRLAYVMLQSGKGPGA